MTSPFSPMKSASWGDERVGVEGPHALEAVGERAAVPAAAIPTPGSARPLRRPANTP